ncbi:MAG: WD40 repeat domain-containing protein [Halobacteria archaeon]|nr:WD40 repeat domain-containing protein [Halobacteria archaeon]
MKRYVGKFLAVTMLLSMVACSMRPVGEAPAIINAQAHSGGSVVAFSPSGDLLASGGWEGTVRLWRMPDGSPGHAWQAHADTVNGMVFTDAGQRLVTAGFDRRIATWSINGQLLGQVESPAPITHMTALEPADRLLTGHADGSVRLWRLSDFSRLQTQVLHRGSVKTVAIAPGGERYASSGSDGAVFTWSEHAPVRRLEDPPTDAWTLAFSPDGQWLMGGSWFRLYRWQLADTTLQTLPTRHRGIIRSIKYLPDGATLASISRQTDSAVYFLDPVTGATLRRFQRHDLCGADISVSADGRYLATTSDDATVRIWDLGAGRPTGAKH